MFLFYLHISKTLSLIWVNRFIFNGIQKLRFHETLPFNFHFIYYLYT